MPVSETFFTRRARRIMRRPHLKGTCLETNRLEDRVVPTIGGFAFLDYNANGTFDTTTTIANDGGTNTNAQPPAGTVSAAIDVGVPGLTVNIFNSAGTLIDTQTTNAAGAWTSTATTAGQQYRIEYSGLAAGFDPGPHGTDNYTTTQFVTDGTLNANLGVVNPSEFSNNDPLLVTSQYSQGGQDASNTTPAIVSFPYSAGSTSINASTDNDNPTTHALSIPADQVGSTWGLAYDQSNSTILASAFTKRHVNWAPASGSNPGGPGMIYIMDSPQEVGGTVTSVTNATPWINLQGATAFLNGTAATITANVVPTAFSAWAANREGQTDPLTDNAYWESDGGNTGWDAVGKTSFGGLSISDDGKFVFVMNLADSRLYVIPVNSDGTPNTTDINAYDIPAIAGVANQADVRPFAVQYHNGIVYVGLVDSAESTVTVAEPGGDPTQLRGYVYTFNPANGTWSDGSVVGDGTTMNGVINGFSLNYTRGTSFGGSDQWRPWSPTVQRETTANDSVAWAQPMISGLTFDSNNNIVISIRDRSGDETGNGIADDPAEPGTLLEGISAGDTLMAFDNVIGSSTAGWSLEENGSSPVAGNPATGFTGTVNGVTVGPGDGQGPAANPNLPSNPATNPNGEFFGTDFYSSGVHLETTTGSAVDIPGFPDVVSTGFDPVITGSFRTGGVRFFDTTDGSLVKSYQLYSQDQGGTGRGTQGSTFGKANGMGDLIAVPTEPPPVEIGNRVFDDANRNGIQDPGELGIGGVTVDLYNATGTTLLASVVTAADGSYYFNSGDNPSGTTTPNEAYDVPGLTVGLGYEVIIPNVSGANVQPALAGLIVTTFNVQTAAYAGDTNQNARNSQLQAVGTNGVIQVAPLTTGQSDHNYDGGFAPGVSLGDFVWNDVNNNGVFDAGEQGVADVPVTLLASDGVTVVGTTTTNASGAYLFTGLAPGNYIVEITSPPGFRSSSGGGLDPLNGPYESGLTTNTNINNTDHGVTVNGNNLSGYTIETKPVTLGTPPNNPNDAGTANLNQDFGIFQAYSIGNRVWKDTNNDGLLDDGELGIDGVTVNLYSPSEFDGTGNLIAGDLPLETTTTANGGYYRFDNLIAGSYVVAIAGGTGPLVNLVSSTGGTSTTTTYEKPVSALPPADGVDLDDDGNTGANGLVRTGVITLGPGGNAPIGETDLVPGLNPQGTVDNLADMTEDFGFYEPLSLGNQIFDDVNNDGVLDNGETGIADVSVTLYHSVAGVISGPALATETTNAGGYYLFTGLGTGSYIVQVNPATLPAGYWQSSSGTNGSLTGPYEPGANPNTNRTDGIDRGTTTGAFVQSAAIALSAGNAPINIPPTPGYTDTAIAADSYRIDDFGFYQPLSLGNQVFNDANNNGILDFGELGINGVPVTLYADTNNDGIFEAGTDTAVAMETTANGGYYLFENLAPGGYFVQITPPAGYSSSTGAQGQATGPFEPGITAFIDNEDHGTNEGSVVRSGLVTLALGAGVVPAAPPTPGYNDPTAPDNQNYTIDFGLYQSLTIGDFVWNDANNDGKFDLGETGLAGVTVQLLNASDAVIATTTTDADGGYDFTNLSAGNYTVRITTPAGYVSSTGTVGSATGPFEPVVGTPGNNEDHGTTDGSFITAAQITLGPAGSPLNPENDGTANLEQDFGLFQPLSIGDFVWNDANNDGILDDGETGLAGVPVTLLDSTGTVTIATTTTDANGNYLFQDLIPGSYTVSILPGDGFISSSGTNGSLTGPFEPGLTGTQNNEDHGTQSGAAIRSTVTLTATGNPDTGGTANLRQDFGVYQPLSIGDFVWNDANNDGVLDNGEEGIGGVPVTLLDSNGNTVGTAITNADGGYDFTDLTPGNYTVQITPPAGFISSTGTNGSATGPYEPGITTNVNNADHGSTSGAFITSTVTLDPAGNAGNPDDAGLANLRQDFGLFEPISVSNLVFIDTNDNGNYDPGEPVLPNVPVTLVDGSGNTVATTTTNASGNYEFIDLTPGEYRVIITPPAGSLPSGIVTDPLASQDNQNVGTAGPNGTLESPLEDLTLGGAPIVGTNTNANSYVTFDFGVLALSSISGYTYFDEKVDGDYTPGVGGDKAFGGITVTLTGVDPSGNPLPTQTAVTDASGFYQFLNLLPGTYTVTKTDPSGYYYKTFATPGSLGGTAANADTLTVTLTPNEAGTQYNFGEAEPAMTYGYVWVDNNKDVQRDDGEPGLADVPITISGTAFAGTKLAHPLTAADLPKGYALTIPTDATGYYAFPELPPGNYSIARGTLPVADQAIYANWGLQNNDPGVNPPTLGNQIFTNVIANVPLRGAFNFGVIPINPNDPSKRNFLGSSSNTASGSTVPLPPPGGPTRAVASENPAFTVTTGDPTANTIVAIGSGAGQSGLVRVLNYSTGSEEYRFQPYGNFTGGIRVATGDVNGDGVPDIITATGVGGGPRIVVYDGKTGAVIMNFFAYESTFRGGVFVAAGDVNDDGKADIIVGTEEGGGPRVRVFSGATGAVLDDFFAFPSTERGGVEVASGDFNGDGKADIATTTGPGVPTMVRIYSGANLALLQQYTPFGAKFSGGATIAVGDVNGDGTPDVIVGTEPGGAPRVQVYNGQDAGTVLLDDFFAFASTDRNGVHVGAADINGDGKADLIVTEGSGGTARVRILDGANVNNAFEDFYALDPDFHGGAYVG